MTLLELCDPLFQYTCRLNRAARKGGGYDQQQVRADVRGIFADCQGKCVSTPGLREQYEKVRLPLVFFVDYTVRTSGLSFANEWKPLAEEEEKEIFTGDELFFDLLEETLKDRAEAATERLAVFYTCMGLGFMGYYETEPETVQRKMKEIAGRIRGLMDADDGGRICPETYESINTADLTTPPMRSLTPIVIGLVGLVLVVLFANGFSYWRNTSELGKAVSTLKDKADSQSFKGAPMPNGGAASQPSGK
jgi:type IV/VI secretion system ImpK/VasF family protein